LEPWIDVEENINFETEVVTNLNMVPKTEGTENPINYGGLLADK
jgi:hypothetical protein